MFNEKKKSWVPLIILVVVIVALIGVFVIGKLIPRSSQYPAEPLSGCVIMQDRGDYENSINIVFLGDNYDDVGEFVEDTEAFTQSLLSVHPFDDYKNRFNIFRIEEFKPLGCSYDEAIICTPATVKIAGSVCPADYFVVLSDVNGVKNLFKFLRSSAWMGVNAINTADNKLVLAHEFAHSFGDFADEYTWEGGRITWHAPNCDTEWETCPMFEIVEDSECWQGCVNHEHSRSVKVGIMRDYWSSSTFGSYNEYVLNDLIEETTVSGGTGEAVLSPPVDVFYVYVSCVGEDCSIARVEEGLGYPDKYISDGNLYVKAGSEFASLKNPLLFLDHGPEGSVSLPDSYESVVIVEREEGVDDIDLVNAKGSVMSSFTLDETIQYGISKKVKLN
jgi:hypothetical protein